MKMFCNQCQEALKGEGCVVAGVCGKNATTSNLQNLFLKTLGELAEYTEIIKEYNNDISVYDDFITEGLFATITNVNFDDRDFEVKIEQTSNLINDIKVFGEKELLSFPELKYNRTFADNESMNEFAGVTATDRDGDPDIISLKELLLFGIKGMAAYHYHANNLGYSDNGVLDFQRKALAAFVNEDAGSEELTGLVLEAGKYGVAVMALLDKANTETYGHPEITSVSTGVRKNPGILVSGHDLVDLEQLLEQTRGTGVDVYTHGEMLPAHYYPAFKKYDNFVGNYGNAWWQQDKEFATFNGPVLMTTNCLVPPRKSYKERVFTTGPVEFPELKHIEENADGKKDFSELINMAKECNAPEEIENGTITGGFAHHTVLSLADKVIDAVKSGAISKFVVMAGCDGRMNERSYYSEFAEGMNDSSVILTAGCAKYRYNKLSLGDINGIPRVLDAGQCNDSYSLAVIALKLKEVFGLEDINDLPIVYNIAWYEQKAVIVLLALLHLGVKNIHLGPTLPAFLSPGVAKLLTETFGIGGISTVENDLEVMAV